MGLHSGTPSPLVQVAEKGLGFDDALVRGLSESFSQVGENSDFFRTSGNASPGTHCKTRMGEVGTIFASNNKICMSRF